MSSIKKLQILSVFFISLTLIFGLVSPVSAMPILSGDNLYGTHWEASDGEGRWASADFAIEGSTLGITLTNLSMDVNNAPNEVLAGIFFDSPGLVLGDTFTVYFDGTIINDDGTDSLLNGEISNEYAVLTNIDNNYC